MGDQTKYYYHGKLMKWMPWPMNLHGMVDRNQILTQIPEIQLLAPIGKIVLIRDIGELCIERAQQLTDLARSQNKKLYIFWSGGIDSTALFLAFREVAKPEEIVIVCNDNSINEYPDFYKKNIEGKYKLEPISMYATWQAVENACTQGIAVTGEIGDQLFGSVNFANYDKVQLFSPWKAILEKEQPSPNLVAAMEPLALACPQKITNLASFLWWLNYSMKYQLVQMRMLLNNTVSILDQNIFHFYDTPDFNDYTVSLPIEEKIPNGDQLAYKMPLRQFILAKTGDMDYFKNKPKVRSLEPKYGNFSVNRLATAIRTDWVREYS